MRLCLEALRDCPQQEYLNSYSIFAAMHYGLSFYKSAPVINLLINIKNRKETEKSENEEDYYDCDDLIIFYLKRLCKDFKKFEDFLDTMVLLTGYLTKNLVKNNFTEEENINKPNEPEKENKEIKKENK